MNQQLPTCGCECGGRHRQHRRCPAEHPDPVEGQRQQVPACQPQLLSGAHTLAATPPQDASLCCAAHLLPDGDTSVVMNTVLLFCSVA